MEVLNKQEAQINNQLIYLILILCYYFEEILIEERRHIIFETLKSVLRHRITSTNTPNKISITHFHNSQFRLDQVKRIVQ